MEGFLTRGRNSFIPGCGGPAALARGAIAAGRWLHEPQPIGIHPVGLGFPHSPKRYLPGGSAFTPPCSWSCRGIERYLTRGWQFIPPGCGRTTALARGGTFAARLLHAPQPIGNHPVGLGCAHPAGRYRPGRSAFLSPG